MDDAVQAAVDEGCATPRVNDTGAVQLQPDLAPAVAVEPAHSPRIGTKGLFPIMDLPSELRLEVRRVHQARGGNFASDIS